MPRPETVRRKHAQKRDQVLFFTSKKLGPRPLDEILQVVPDSFRKKAKVLSGWVNDDNKQRYVVLFPDAKACQTVYDKKQVTDSHKWTSRKYQNFTLEAKKHSSDALRKLRREEDGMLQSVAQIVSYDLVISSDPSPLARITPNWLLINPQLREQLNSVFGATFDVSNLKMAIITTRVDINLTHLQGRWD
ncbi:hypothetical protein M407DRAFT_34155 [Tulasnella calospora MUT 4182]|uniref:Uncharacterized protein n=1 Tax=Tulasnella calospora MUT 4182 TaxID=1051891 RepID=A0A0C3PP20_9AGAM|nr:hypothetical protein M407DRAFT_34155 [Tulasnella calospora MUT 4182]